MLLHCFRPDPVTIFEICILLMVDIYVKELIGYVKKYYIFEADIGSCKCSFPMTPPVRPLVGWMVGLS